MVAKVRTVLVRETPPEWVEGAPLRGPQDVVAYATTLLECEPQECFVVFFLNAQHEVQGYEVVTRGIVDASLIHPREVFRCAILANASAVILVHNHPSGNPTPSREDKEVTKAIRKAGEVVGIPVLDHLIVGANGHTSLAEQGMME